MTGKGRGWLDWLIDLFFPARCYGCGRRGLWLCPPCIADLPKLDPPLCRFCGRPTGGVLTCPDCWKERPATDGIHSAYVFVDPLRPVIHRFKYRHAEYLAEPLSNLFTQAIDRLPEADVIVPVPLHASRQRDRGYNQAALLVAKLAPQLGLIIVDDCLRRVRDTPPQMGLSSADRRRNMRHAFRCYDRRLAGLRVVLVDDVCTTGATLDACARALKASGVTRVTGLTIARAR